MKKRKDEFAELERRWRTQPLFLPKRSRKPLWTSIGLTVVLGVLAGAVVFEEQNPSAFLHRIIRLAEGMPAALSARALPQQIAFPLRHHAF
jgi:hypothetical protein